MSRHMVDTTEGPLWSKSLALAWPAVLQAILVNFYAFNDYFFVGLTSDKAATAALSSCFAILMIHFTVVRILPTGGTTLIAQYTGARRTADVANVFRAALVSSMVGATAAGLIAYVYLDSIVAVNNALPDVSLRIGDYLRVLFISAPAFSLMLVVDGAFRARGNTRIPLGLEVLSLVLNTFLNWVLVLGNLGFAARGIEGAAIATALSRALPGLIGLFLMLRGALLFDPRGPWRLWQPTLEIVRRMARIGLFESMSTALYGLVYLVMNRMAGEIGPEAQGGLGAGLRGIEWLGFAFGDGFLVATVTIVGQNIGAGQRQRAWRGAWMTALTSALLCQLVGFAFVLFPDAFSALVTDDPLTHQFASDYVWIIGWFMWAVGFEMAFYGAFIGCGRTEITLFVSGLLNIARVPIVAGLLFGWDQLLPATLWATTGVGMAPALTGSFVVIAWTIGGTAVAKALFYLVWMARRRSL